MAITGGVKFFDTDSAGLFYGGSATASNGNDLAGNSLDRNKVTYWRTTGSDDSETVEFILTLGSSTTFNRLFLIDHNFRSFVIDYDVSGVWTDFSNVVGITGSLGSSITESSFSENTSYYEFNSVTTSSIRIRVTTTQTADAEKYLNQIVVTTELGTLSGFPLINRLRSSRNDREVNMLSGKKLVIKSKESLEFQLDFKDYPANLKSDLDLMFDLYDRDEVFMVWICGGRYSTPYYRYTNRGFRLQDLITAQLSGDISPSYTSNVTSLPVNLRVQFVEVVD